MSYNQLKQETEAKWTWPDCKMESVRNYNFIIRVGQELGVDMDDLVELWKAVLEAIGLVKWQGMQVIMGEWDGWVAVAKLQWNPGSFLDQFVTKSLWQERRPRMK